ncbi:protein inturned isoform X2 [Daktulosphaira vitifoliae]|uniref:protein inturned isoform X2 n=1 Tax=Daktulosphaira vitifoliae TaxID=58002 RepID=UPI0021AB01C8|nr:protein inturned isoform X2 [Daktulosphaira vitifoliae]
MTDERSTPKSYEMYLEDNDSTSSISSCDCSDINSHNDWMSEVNFKGELFYIKSSPRKIHNFSKRDMGSPNYQEKRKTATSKFVKLLKRKNRRRDRSDTCKQGGNTNKVTFLDTQEFEIKEVTIVVNDDNCSNFGRRATLSEKLLGFSTSVFEDKSRVMVTSIIPDTFIDSQKIIKIGDWLKMINGEIITANTLKEILSKINPPTTVTVVVQRLAASLVEIDRYVSGQLSSYYSSNTTHDILISELLKYPIGIMFLMDNIPEAIYIYPKKSSIFYQIRGAFQTIINITPKIVKDQVSSTSMLYDDQLVHSLFWLEDLGTLIFIVPDSKLNINHAKWIMANVVKYLCFCYKNLNNCFSKSENSSSLDRYFSIMFSELFCINIFQDIIKLKKIEQIFSASKSVPLARSVQMELDDILNEFEANYIYEDMKQQRPYNIIGTSIYYKEYLLASHLNYNDHLDVYTFCQQNGLFHILHTEYLERLIIFQQVYPSSSRNNYSSIESVYILPKAVWYLLLVGRGKNLMATLLEVGPHCSKSEVCNGPDVNYVEEAEDTLENILNMNIDEVVNKWINGNLFEINQESIKNQSSINTRDSPVKKPEIISILKHKNETSSPILYFDSKQCDSLSETSLTSSGAQSTEDGMYVQGPVLGRRAERMMKASSLDWSDNSDDCTISESSRSIDNSDSNKSIAVLPNKFNINKLNMLFYFIDLNCETGIMLCSPTMFNNDLMGKNMIEMIEYNFNKTVDIIHESFNESIQDDNEIDEVNVLFKIPSNIDSPKKSTAISFCVTGKLLKIPARREIYICYEDGVPQNMVEIGFKLGICAVG